MALLPLDYMSTVNKKSKCKNISQKMLSLCTELELFTLLNLYIQLSACTLVVTMLGFSKWKYGNKRSFCISVTQAPYKMTWNPHKGYTAQALALSNKQNDSSWKYNKNIVLYFCTSSIHNCMSSQHIYHYWTHISLLYILSTW